MSILKRRTASVRIYGITDFDSDGVDELAIYTFTFPECFFEFNISQIESDSPNSCYLKIYGVSRDTYKIFEEAKFKKYNKEQICEIYYGYDRDEEVVYRGTISRVSYRFNFGEQYIEFILDQNMKKFHTQRHSLCIQRQSTVYEAINIVCKEFGYKFECINRDELSSMTLAPVTIEGNFRQCIECLLNKNSSFYIDNATLITFGKTNKIIENADKTAKRIYTLTVDNGLKAYPLMDTGKTDDVDTYKIVNKLLPGISPGDIIKIPISDDGLFSPIDTGKYEEYIVQEFVSKFSSSQDSTEMECVKKNG